MAREHDIPHSTPGHVLPSFLARAACLDRGETSWHGQVVSPPLEDMLEIVTLYDEGLKFILTSPWGTDGIVES